MNFSIFSKIKSSKAFTPTPKSLVWGFTLVELIVVIAIATAIMTALVIQQGSWNDRLRLNTSAYELVLMIRQAQIYSLGVREDTGGTGDKFSVGYGVHVAIITSASSEIYNFFADRNGDHTCDSRCSSQGNNKNNNENANFSNEWIEDKKLPTGIKISKICTPTQTGSSCNPSNNKILAITFFRPDPKAYRYIGGNGNPPTYVAINPNDPVYIKIQKTDGTGAEATIKIEGNGQISVVQ